MSDVLKYSSNSFMEERSKLIRTIIANVPELKNTVYGLHASSQNGSIEYIIALSVFVGYGDVNDIDKIAFGDFALLDYTICLHDYVMENLDQVRAIVSFRLL